MVSWARDPWRVSDRMGRLRGSSGLWLDGDGAKVDWLVRDVFGEPAEDPVPWVGEALLVDFPYSRGEVRGWVLCALGRTRNGSAPAPDGISYRLIKVCGSDDPPKSISYMPFLYPSFLSHPPS